MGLALSPFESGDGFRAVLESRRVSLAENAQGIRHEQYSHRGRRQHHSEMRRNRRCRCRSKSMPFFTLMSRSNAPGPSPFASQFRVVMCARPQRERVTFPACLELFPTGRRAVSARATSKCSLVTQKCPVCHDISTG